MAARRVIIGHVSGDDELFQEEDALTRSNSLWFAEVKDGFISAADPCNGESATVNSSLGGVAGTFGSDCADLELD